MKKIFISSLVGVLLLTACVVKPGRHGRLEVVPLPPVVVLDVEPYYFHSGYHYHYLNGRWYYSASRKGPWNDLPRGHYPKEVRFKGKEKNRGWSKDRDNHRR